MSKRTAFWSIVLGIVLAQSMVIWLGPKYLLWYFSPPAPMGFDCSSAVGWALSRMQRALLWGTLAGVIFGLIGGFVFRRQIKNYGLPPSAT